MSALRLIISGRVQGVGYREWLVKRASRLGLSGWVRNRSDGTVEAQLEGPDAAISACVAACLKGPMLAVVREIERIEAPHSGAAGFERLPTL